MDTLPNHTRNFNTSPRIGWPVHIGEIAYRLAVTKAELLEAAQ